MTVNIEKLQSEQGANVTYLIPEPTHEQRVRLWQLLQAMTHGNAIDAQLRMYVEGSGE